MYVHVYLQTHIVVLRLRHARRRFVGVALPSAASPGRGRVGVHSGGLAGPAPRCRSAALVRRPCQGRAGCRLHVMYAGDGCGLPLDSLDSICRRASGRLRGQDAEDGRAAGDGCATRQIERHQGTLTYVSARVLRTAAAAWPACIPSSAASPRRRQPSSRRPTTGSTCRDPRPCRRDDRRPGCHSRFAVCPTGKR